MTDDVVDVLMFKDHAIFVFRSGKRLAFPLRPRVFDDDVILLIQGD